MEEYFQEAKVKSTKEGMKRFVEGTIWEDMFNEMKIWDNMLLKSYDDCVSLEDLRRLQGCREAIAYCMQLPDRIIEALEDQEDKKEE